MGYLIYTARKSRENYNNISSDLAELLMAKCSDGTPKLTPEQMSFINTHIDEYNKACGTLLNESEDALEAYTYAARIGAIMDVLTLGLSKCEKFQDISKKFNELIKDLSHKNEVMGGINDYLWDHIDWDRITDRQFDCIAGLVITADKAYYPLIDELLDRLNGFISSEAIKKVTDFRGIQITNQLINETREYIEDEGNRLKANIKQLSKKCDDGKDQEPLNSQPMNRIDDPSGYVCEAVPSNRIEGVTTTAYYEGDELNDFGEPTGNKIPYVWDASDYDQVNPLITDANGEYAWDVPQGQWQVKYEKEGYETAYSEWLPVPPPQMEVHVALVSTANPEVKSVNAYTTRLRIEFSRYMDIGSVNTDNVTVTVDGVPVSGTITPLNSESSFDDPSVEYASIFTFVPDNEISGEAAVDIKNVVAYNGKALTEAYNTTVPVEYEPQSIEVQETASVAYSGETLITLQILPAEAGANKSITITSSSPSIASVSTETVTTDENGNAAFAVNGNLPGSGEISFALEGTDITASTSVTVGSVSQGSTEACQKVTASIASGTEVERGTELTLSTATEGAEIYYTLDRTCPCIVDNPSRTKYTVPIEINEDMYIVAYAVKDGFEDSATAAFNYTVESEATQPSGGGGSGSARRYTVTFDTQGGSTIDSVSVFSYNTLNEPAAPVREGYSFDGWYTDQDCTEPYDFSTRVTQNITLYAKWTPESEEPPATAEPDDSGSTFDDVSESDWFYEYVEYAYDNGLMTGVSENEFAPDTAITRGMFVTVLHRMENEPAAEKAKFDDVDDGAYYADAVAWASENGIVEGFSAEEFRPDQSITREQMAVIIYRYADLKGHDISRGAELAYSDTESISEYARTAVEWTAAASIIQGNDNNTFAPQGTTTRAQAAAVFVRLLNIN